MTHRTMRDFLAVLEGNGMLRRISEPVDPMWGVTVVDDDVDICDPIHVDWALNSRFNPARDTVLIDEVSANLPVGQLQLPSVLTGKIIDDATLKFDAGTFSLPPKQIMTKALDRWKELGLPEFETPKRTRLRIDHP